MSSPRPWRSSCTFRPAPLGPTLLEYLTPLPTRERVVDVDGDQHDTLGACGCDDVCLDCGGRAHYQHTHGGFWRKCDQCEDAGWEHRRGLLVPGGGSLLPARRAYLDAPRRVDECSGEIEAP